MVEREATEASMVDLMVLLRPGLVALVLVVRLRLRLWVSVEVERRGRRQGLRVVSQGRVRRGGGRREDVER